MINLNEAIVKLKKAGSKNVRIVPMKGQPIAGGMHKIEIQEGGDWSCVVESLPKSAAEAIVTQATNRVILG